VAEVALTPITCHCKMWGSTLRWELDNRHNVIRKQDSGCSELRLWPSKQNIPHSINLKIKLLYRYTNPQKIHYFYCYLTAHCWIEMTVGEALSEGYTVPLFGSRGHSCLQAESQSCPGGASMTSAVIEPWLTQWMTAEKKAFIWNLGATQQQHTVK